MQCDRSTRDGSWAHRSPDLIASTVWCKDPCLEVKVACAGCITGTRTTISNARSKQGNSFKDRYIDTVQPVESMPCTILTPIISSPATLPSTQQKFHHTQSTTSDNWRELYAFNGIQSVGTCGQFVSSMKMKRLLLGRLRFCMSLKVGSND